MQTAIIAGCFAFLGAVIGQLLSRNTQRETWLLQKRAEVFSKFLTDLDVYNQEISRINNSTVSSVDEWKDKADALDKVKISEKIVCLYLSDASKKEFRTLFENYHTFTPDCYTAGEFDMEKLKTCWEPHFQTEENIQKLFEKNLSDISWYK